MIIGNGLIANAFKKHEKDFDGFVVFASGVSNSDERDISKFKREEDLLLDTLTNNSLSKMIYFSSVLTGIVDNHYYKHKLAMETLVKLFNSDNLIFRIPQVIGETGNKNNLVNFIRKTLIQHQEIICYTNVFRSILGVDDLVDIVNYCKDLNSDEPILISGIEKVSALDLILIIANILEVEPRILKSVSHGENNWKFKNSEIIDKAINECGIEKENYTYNIIKNYTQW